MWNLYDLLLDVLHGRLHTEKTVVHGIHVEEGATTPNHLLAQPSPEELSAEVHYVASSLKKGKLHACRSLYGALLFLAREKIEILRFVVVTVHVFLSKRATALHCQGRMNCLTTWEKH